jgi:hypothetical protein
MCCCWCLNYGIIYCELQLHFVIRHHMSVSTFFLRKNTKTLITVYRFPCIHRYSVSLLAVVVSVLYDDSESFNIATADWNPSPHVENQFVAAQPMFVTTRCESYFIVVLVLYNSQFSDGVGRDCFYLRCWRIVSCWLHLIASCCVNSRMNCFVLPCYLYKVLRQMNRMCSATWLLWTVCSTINYIILAESVFRKLWTSGSSETK